MTDQPSNIPPALPLSYESPPAVTRHKGGPVAVIIIGLLLVFLGGCGWLVAFHESRYHSDAAIALAIGSTIIVLPGLYLIIIAAHRLVR